MPGVGNYDKGVVYLKGVLLHSWSADWYRMPFVVIKTGLRVVSYSNGFVSQIEKVMNVSVD